MIRSIERKECIENLKILGLYDAISGPISSSGKQEVAESSFDVPNYAAFPLILYGLFNYVNEGECHRRFKNCWPVFTPTDRVKFRQVALLWNQQLKKTEPHGTIPDLSSLFETPFGDRYVTFLLKFSTYVLKKRCQMRGGDSFTERLSSSSRASVSSNGSAKALDDEYESLDGQIDRFRDHADTVIQSFKNDLMKEYEAMEQQSDLLQKRLLKLALRLNCKQEQIETEINNGNLKQLAEQCTTKANRELQRYCSIWDDLQTLFDRRKAFDSAYELAVGNKTTLRGIEPSKMISAPDLLKDVTQNGRLDIPKLVAVLQSVVRLLQTKMHETTDASTSLATLRENIHVPQLLLREEEQLAEKLKTLKGEMENCTKVLRKNIAQFRQSPAVSSSPPKWLRVLPIYRYKHRRNVDLNLELQPDLDWSAICSFDDDRPSSIKATTPRKLPIMRVTSTQETSCCEIKTEPATVVNHQSANKTSVRKVRLSISPLSPFGLLSSSLDTPAANNGSAANFVNSTRQRLRAGGDGNNGNLTVTTEKCNYNNDPRRRVSFASSGIFDDSPPSADSIYASRRLSIRLQSDFLKMMESDEL